jgi:hypothetical protein
MALTTSSKLLAPPRVGLDAVIVAFRRNRVTYTPAEVHGIVWAYVDLAPSVGLDPLVALAQLALETGWLTSSWSAEPHRNPAGIGVTGQPGAGVDFPAWSDAARAHVGRLLAYAINIGAETPRQKMLIAEALGWRALPDLKRGKVVTVGQLSGTWAADPDYGAKLVRMAERIVAGPLTAMAPDEHVTEAVERAEPGRGVNDG